MSKRTQSIRSLFAAGNEEGSVPEQRVPVQRVASGAVRSLHDTFSEVERENEVLKQRLAEGALPVELDTTLIDPSPFADRIADQDTAAIEALKASIREHGQEIPILVRPHPTQPGRYQVAYGHRRLRATSELGITVKASVRELDDQRLVVAQGIENTAREDLSFIERATFAERLENAGFQRTVIQLALSVDKSEVSKLIAVAGAIPGWILVAIGRAPKIGRNRWQELADLIKAGFSEEKTRAMVANSAFDRDDSDERFTAILRSLKSAQTPARDKAEQRVATSADGTAIATLSLSAKTCRIEMNRARDEDFAAFVMRQLPELYRSFKDNPSTEG